VQDAWAQGSETNDLKTVRTCRRAWTVMARPARSRVTATLTRWSSPPGIHSWSIGIPNVGWTRRTVSSSFAGSVTRDDPRPLTEKRGFTTTG
jgi:hypothetical protein